MALSQALSTGITGLMSHQKAMDNIGNNLANVNTTGFKKGVYQFTTILEQTLRGGMMADSSTGRGSVNPITLGLGTVTGSINKVFTQGSIENTGNPNDMAIEGNGFFVLKQGNGFAYTRAGSFYRGEDGSLMAAQGLYVQGTMAVKNSDGSYSIPQDAKLQNIVIPIGTTGGHSQTTQAGFAGNLDSRQKVSTGIRLFGDVSYPTVNNLQSWMWKDFNGGDSYTNSKVDKTWNSLEEKTYVVSQETLARATAAGVTVPANLWPSSVATYANGVVQTTGANDYAYFGINTVTGQVEAVYGLDADGNRIPTSVDTLINTGIGGVKYIPIAEEVKTINGGNVLTSTAYVVKVPDALADNQTYTDPNTRQKYTIATNNTYTYPAWFYESTGSPLTYQQIVDDMNAVAGGGMTWDAALRDIWPSGINGNGWPTSTLTQANLPAVGETYAASLTTPLENLWYQKGNSWVQPFANIRDGDEITISFKKGESQVTTTFKYNRPSAPPPNTNIGQQPLDIEHSYTLSDFVKFLGGDVDEPSAMCSNITPAMYGAPVDSAHPYGDTSSPLFDRTAYETALRNVGLAKTESNMDSTGGAMGLLSIPPQISPANYGTDGYDSPVESAGAYTRTGVSEVEYMRMINGNLEKVKEPSFNISFVSNLGKQNALSDLKITYNSVPHESMYTNEKTYNAPEGGSAMWTMNFYDSLGNPKQAVIRLAMVEKDTDFTTWRWYADCVDDTDFPWQADPVTGELISNLNVGTGLIRFDNKGNFVDGCDFSETQGITINQVMQGVNEPILIKILNGLGSGNTQDLDFSDLTCTADENSFKLASQNGRPPGTLDDFTVSEDGVIQGIYSNGNVVNIARIGLAIIPNMNGLIAAGNNLYYTGPASGQARYGHALTGGNGAIRHQQLESSNVDLSEEFTKLITTERGFQANSRTITTADEMITELLNLKR